jgi:transcriptional regulator with XRE-family HTH domain
MSRDEAALGSLMPARMRRRREARSISGADLARRVGVSPAYVSQIEKGLRVPDVPVALRIATALEDDEALYVAWSRDHKARSRTKSSPAGDDDAWTRLYRSDRFDDEASFGRAVRSGHDLPQARGRLPESRGTGLATPSRMGAPVESSPLFDLPAAPLAAGPRPSSREEGRPLVPAPLLEPGADPGEREEVPRQLRVDQLLIDPRLLGTRPGRPFAFRADEEVSRRVRDRIDPGDLVIVARDLGDDAPVPGRVYALRRAGRIVLGRLARLGDRFLVPPGPGETEMLDVGLVAGGPAKPAVAGEVVAVVKGG